MLVHPLYICLNSYHSVQIGSAFCIEKIHVEFTCINTLTDWALKKLFVETNIQFVLYFKYIPYLCIHTKGDKNTYNIHVHSRYDMNISNITSIYYWSV